MATPTQSGTKLPARHPAGHRPIHPGEHLREDYMADYGLTAYRLAKALRVPRGRIESLVREQRAITPDTALRLARYFGTTAAYWLNLQTAYDLAIAERSLGAELSAIEPATAPPEEA